MKCLITGGLGFIGSNLALDLLKKDYELTIIDNVSRHGSQENITLLKNHGHFSFYETDIREKNTLETIIKNTKPDVIFHFAAQVAMTTSLQNPMTDFEINVLGSLYLLEAVRKWSPDSIVIYTSTNKVYGDLAWVIYEETDTRYHTSHFPYGFDETLPLNFQTPYGCSKGAVDQYMLDYHRIYGLKTIVFRNSSVYGGLQHSTEDQGWLGWFLSRAMKCVHNNHTEPFNISGNGKQVRDLLHVSDLIQAFHKAIHHNTKTAGESFNIGGGMKNSLSLQELFAFLETTLNIKMNYHAKEARLHDQKVFVANTKKARDYFHWEPKITFQRGIEATIDWLQSGLHYA